MYTPDRFKLKGQDELFRFIQTHSFGVLVSGELEATHLPFLLEKSEGECGTLYTHFARANAHWKSLDGKDVLVIFSGPHSYISPTWYGDAPAVPTWNYASVHVTGRLSVLPATDTNDVLNRTLAHYEPALLNDRAVVTQAFQDKLNAAIVPVKLDITKLQGQVKLGQHKPSDAQQNVYKALLASEHPDAQQLAKFMHEWQLGTGDTSKPPSN